MIRFIELNDEQTEQIETRLSDYDDRFMTVKMDGSIRIGIEENGKLIAGLDACMTAFRILYVSTVFVEESCRRKGYGRLLMEEMEKRAKALGANTIRLDTFSWQGKEFYEALDYKIVGHYENLTDHYEEYFFIKYL